MARRRIRLYRSGTNAAPAFTQQSAPGGQVGVAYSYAFVATGATSYSLGSGSLPAGLTLSSGGVLSGTPTTATGYTFTVNATGPGGTTASSSQNVTIAAASAPVFTAQSAPAGQVGSAYSYTFAATGATSFSLASGSLPAGLSLASNGVLSGTPTTAATYTFVVNATGPGGTTPSTSQSVTIAAAGATGTATITWQPPTDSSGITGYNVYSQLASADPYTGTWSLAGSVNSSTFTYTYTALTNGQTYRFLVRAVSAVGETPLGPPTPDTPIA